MNILFFDSIDKDIFGGLENWIGIVASSFARKGHQVTVAGRPDSEFLKRLSSLGENIDTLPVNISGDFNPLTIFKIKRLLKRKHIDIVVVNFNKDIRLAGLAARWHGKTKVIWRVGLDITKDTFIHHFLTPKLIDGVITPSHALKQEITHLVYIPAEMVEVIHNGTTIKDFKRPDYEAREALRSKYDLPSDSTIIVTVGRFVNHKGHIHLIEAAPKIVEKHPNVIFLFLGDGYLEQQHRARIQELHLTGHFVFAGMLSTLDPELAGADMVVHPSIIEPFSNALLECMRAGLPIVATRVGGTAEAISDGDCGILVDPASPEQLAAEIVKLLDNPTTMNRLGQSAKKRWRERFTVDIMVEKVENHLRKFLE